MKHKINLSLLLLSAVITAYAQTDNYQTLGIDTDSYTLVTNANELQVGDKVIFGVADQKTDYIMGVFDENNSKNNIHAVKATYSPDRTTVNENEIALYTIGTVEHEGKQYFTFMDCTGYYLVASGGNPNKGNNNYLTVWDKVDSPNYGLYGGWTIDISATGEATIQSMGTSRSNLLQYNPNGTKHIFACYPDLSQTPVALYKYTHVDTSQPYIQGGIVNFGTLLQGEDNLTGERTIEINAINLTADIQTRLSKGDIFSVNKQSVDKNGESIAITYATDAVGIYTDTLWLTSNGTQARYTLHLQVSKRLTVAEVKQQSQQTLCHLQPVTITKKYNKHIFVEDATGSLLLYDGANLYGKDLKNGYILTGVTGKYNDYYSNPSLNLTDKFYSTAGEVCLPTLQTDPLAMTDVCRYVRMENVSFDNNDNLLVGNNTYPLYNLFNCAIATQPDMLYNIEGIVYFYDEIVLCPTLIEQSATDFADIALQDISYRNGIIENPQRLSLQIYTATGLLLCESNTDINMHTCPEGVYIIAHQGQTVRIIK